MNFFKQMTKQAAQKGFSLVELMIVVAIIGILSSLAVPKFQAFQAKAKQSEAKNNLSHIYTLEQTYYGDNDAFGTEAAIGFSTQGGAGATKNQPRYNYVAAPNGAGKFTATATAKTPDAILAGCGASDTWTIDENKALNVTVDCAQK